MLAWSAWLVVRPVPMSFFFEINVFWRSYPDAQVSLGRAGRPGQLHERAIRSGMVVLCVVPSFVGEPLVPAAD